MFFRLTFYQIKRLIHKKDTLFWTLCFPVLLGTMFYFGFGNVMEDNEVMKEIPIAIVEQGEVDTDADFVRVINELSGDSENAMFITKNVTEEEASVLLNQEKIKGYYRAGKEIELVVGGSDIQQNIMKQVVDQYKRLKTVIADLIAADPTMATNQSALRNVIEQISNGTEYTKEVTLGSGKSDSMVVYFYALIAMVCIYGSLMGADIVNELEGNMTLLGARRNFAPASKLMQVVSDVLGSYIIHLTEVFIVIIYLKNVLKLDFGDQMGLIMLACAFGSLIGIAMGTFICMVVPAKKTGREAAVLAISMGLCFLSGLMVADLPYMIEKTCPIINRINPCMLLVNSLYSLNIYTTLNKYYTCLASMAVIAVIFFGATILMMRRRRYASL